jgi:hypothetical protein
MRQGSCGTSGVSTETIRPVLCSAGCPMCLPAPLSCGVANVLGTAAKPAPRLRLVKRKLRLFFMILPLQRLVDPTVHGNFGHWIKRGCTRSQSTASRGVGYSAARGKWRNSDAKDGKRCCMGRGRSGWSAVQTPRGGETGSQKLCRTVEDYRR